MNGGIALQCTMGAQLRFPSSVHFITKYELILELTTLSAYAFQLVSLHLTVGLGRTIQQHCPRLVTRLIQTLRKLSYILSSFDSD